MQISDSLAREIAPLEAELERAAQAGRDQDVMAILARILAIAPTHAPALAAVGQRSFRQGDMQTAREAFQRLVEVRATTRRSGSTWRSPAGAWKTSRESRMRSSGR